MLWSVLDTFLPSSYHTSPNPDLQRRGRLFVAASICFFLIALFFGIQMAIVDRYPLSNVLVMFSGCVLVVINLWLLGRMRSTAIPGALLCLELLSIHWFEAYNDLGLRDPVLIWMLVIPWLAAFLVGPAFGFAFGGLVILAISSFYVLELSGHVFPDYTGPEEYWLYYLLCTSTLALFLGFLGWIYERQTLALREANQDLRGMHADLQKSHRQAEQILAHLTDGFFTLDASWRFTEVSGQVEHLLNKSRGAIIGRPAGPYFSGHISKGARYKLGEASQTGRPVRFETFYAPLRRWFDVLVCPHTGGVSVYFSDITVRKGLVTAGEELECLAVLEDDLLAGNGRTDLYVAEDIPIGHAE